MILLSILGLLFGCIALVGSLAFESKISRLLMMFIGISLIIINFVFILLEV